MNDKEAIEMMNRCKHEIIQLRAKIERMQPKAEAYDNIQIILNLLPKQGGCYGEDLVWTLEKRIKEMQDNEVKDGQ